MFFPSFYFVFYEYFGSDFPLLQRKYTCHATPLSQKKSILYTASYDRETPNPHWMQVQ